MNQVYQRLNAARAEFHKHKLTKTGYNSFSNFSYFELSDFLPHAMTAFADHGLCAIISFGTELATMTIVDTDESGGAITITSPMSTASLKACHPVQNLGAVETYLRRYLWSAALELIESDPADASAGPEDKKSPAQPPPAPPAPPAPKGQGTAKRPPARKATEGDEEIWDVTISSITESKGMGKNGKPFKRWQLDFEDGRKISTFDKAIAGSLEEGQEVRLVVTQDGKFHKLVGIEEASEELVKPESKAEVWQTEILNVEKSQNGKYYQVFINDIEHPWVGTTDEKLSVKAAQWIEAGDVSIQVKRGKGLVWQLVDLPKYEASLEQEFGEEAE